MSNPLKKAISYALSVAYLMTMHTSVAQEKSARLKSTVTVKVLAVEPSPGVWSGYVEVDQWLSVSVTDSTDDRFNKGQRYRIGVAITPGPLFEKDSPKFSSSLVSEGKLLQIKQSSGRCIHLPEKDGSIRVAAECIASLP